MKHCMDSPAQEAAFSEAFQHRQRHLKPEETSESSSAADATSTLARANDTPGKTLSRKIRGTNPKPLWPKPLTATQEELILGAFLEVTCEAGVRPYDSPNGVSYQPDCLERLFFESWAGPQAPQGRFSARDEVKVLQKLGATETAHLFCARDVDL